MFEHNFTASLLVLPNATETAASSATSMGLVVLSFCQVFLGVVGVAGNSLCFFVLRHQSERNHTNWLIISQCLADFLASFLLVVSTIHINWFSDGPSSGGGLPAKLFCILWDSIVMVFAGFAISTFNLTAISVERYIAVVHPMSYIKRFNRKTLYVLAATAWLTAPFLQAILAATHFEYREGECYYVNSGPAVGVALFIWEYLIPVIIMGYCFIQIAIKLRSLNRVGNAWRDIEASTAAPTRVGQRSEVLSDQASVAVEPNATAANHVDAGTSTGKNPLAARAASGGNVRRRNITITLLIVYLTYLVCWTPNQFAFLVFNFGVLGDYIGSAGHVFTTALATLNTCINPIVYAFKYKAFRKGLADIFTKCVRGPQ